MLPRSGYQMGGAAIAPGQTTVTIVVNKTPVPTAQISIFVYDDNHPINGGPSLPQEQGLANFSITLKEAGGTYGESGGQVTQDAFGNPIGTTYQKLADGSFVYNPDGRPNVVALGSGFIKSGPDGVALIKYLFPGKYTIEAIPPAGWHQTSTIEGTKGIDAWVKSNEPPFFQEFGPAGHHVDIGFVNKTNDTTVLSGSHDHRQGGESAYVAPAGFPFFNGDPVPNCWVGLNDLAVVEGVPYMPNRATPTAPSPSPMCPPGNYQLVVWDEVLDRHLCFRPT